MLPQRVAGWKRDGHVDQGVLWILDDHARGLLDVQDADEAALTLQVPTHTTNLDDVFFAVTGSENR